MVTFQVTRFARSLSMLDRQSGDLATLSYRREDSSSEALFAILVFCRRIHRPTAPTAHPGAQRYPYLVSETARKKPADSNLDGTFHVQNASLLAGPSCKETAHSK